MEKDIKPVEEGNAEVINQKCHSNIFPLLQYEQIADYYSGEPLYIRARLNKGEKLNTYEQILRMRYAIPNNKLNSWCIYSMDREWPFKESKKSGMIIRNVIWDRNYDINLVRGNPSIKQQHRWPTMAIKNIYINNDNVLDLTKNIKEFDQLVHRGIKIQQRDLKEHPQWVYLEVMRWFDWGQVKATWDPYVMMNHEIEMHVIKLNAILEEYKDNVQEFICQMDLDYLIPPEIFKKYIQGVE